jgi:hypothetical protein
MFVYVQHLVKMTESLLVSCTMIVARAFVHIGNKSLDILLMVCYHKIIIRRRANGF